MSMDRIRPGAVPPVDKAELPPLQQRPTPVEAGDAAREEDQHKAGRAPQAETAATPRPAPDDREGRTLVARALKEAEKRKVKTLEGPKDPKQRIIDHDTIPPQKGGR